jgi:spore coat protein U-like protein
MFQMPSAVDLRRLALAAGLLLMVLLAMPRRAEAACTASVTGVTFAAVDALAGATVNAQATLNFSCTGMTPVVPISLCPNLDGGSGGTDGAGGRRMVGPGGATLNFQIYQDSGRTQVWGSSALLVFGAVPTVTVVPNLQGSASTTRTLYLSVTGVASAPTGTYSTTFSNQGFFYGLNLLSCAGVTIGTFITPQPFTFEAPINPDCGVSSTNMSFGDVGLLNTAKPAENTLTVRCTANTPWSLSLNNGNTGTAPDTRYMVKNGASIRYGIYRDTDRTLLWGTTAAGLGLGGTGTGANQPVKAYGRIPVQATPAPGLYTDNVVATLTY